MTARDEILNAITIEDVPAECRDLALFLGLECFVDLCFAFSGEQIYVPSISKLYNRARNKRIIEEYQMEIGEECDKLRIIKRIAKKHCLSVRQLYNILKDAKLNTQSEQTFE